MNFGVITTTLSLGLTVALASTASDLAATESQWAPEMRLAQASPNAKTTNNLQGTGLTASHKRIIYDNIASEQEQTLSGILSLQLEAPFPTCSYSIRCRSRLRIRSAC